MNTREAIEKAFKFNGKLTNQGVVSYVKKKFGITTSKHYVYLVRRNMKFQDLKSKVKTQRIPLENGDAYEVSWKVNNNGDQIHKYDSVFDVAQRIATAIENCEPVKRDFAFRMAVEHVDNK